MVARRIVVLFALLALCSASSGGTIRTLDGKTCQGELHLDADGTLLVHPRQGADVRIQASNLLEADFKDALPTKPAAAVVIGSLPGPWQADDIGKSVLGGSVRCSAGTFDARAAGAGIHGHNDSFYFIHQALHGDGQIVARIRDFQPGRGTAKAGVMIRRSLDPTASQAMFVMEGQRGSHFSYRNQDRNDAEHGAHDAGDAVPCWLLLSRRGTTLTAARSTDGSRWENVGSTDIDMGGSALIGLCLTSQDANALCTAEFDQVSVGPLNESPKFTAPTGEIAYSKAVILRSGTIIGNASVTALREQKAQFTDANGALFTLPFAAIARLTFVPLPPDALAKIPEHQVGVLKVNGDFIEGELAAYDRGRVQLSSVLFGLQDIPLRTDAAALVLGDVTPEPAPFAVRTTNGSLFQARSIKIERDVLVVEDSSLGPVRLPAWQLLEIKAGGDRLVRLATLKPAKVEPPSGVTPSAAWSASGEFAGRPVVLDGAPAEHAITTLAGAAITYSLDAHYAAFLCRCGVPAGILPAETVRLIVTADGREIFRGPPCTSLDESTSLSLPVAGARALTLRVESSGPFPIAVAWADAELVK